MNKTYSEQYQAVLFRAAAATYDVATKVLEDCTTDLEFSGATYQWTKDTARTYAERAQSLKNDALEVCSVYDGRTASGYNRAQRRYSKAVDRHIQRHTEVVTGSTRDAIGVRGFA